MKLNFLVFRMGFPGGSDGEESTCNVGGPGLIPASGKSLGEGNGYRLQYSCRKNSLKRGTWQATVWGCNESDMTEQLTLMFRRVSQVALVVKKLPANAGYVRSLGQEDHLEEGKATHSSILAWRIPRREEPGRLQFKGLQRVRHN